MELTRGPDSSPAGSRLMTHGALEKDGEWNFRLYKGGR